MDLPRTLGDPRRVQAIDALADRFEQSTRFPPRIRRQHLVGRDPQTNDPYALTNLIVDYRPQAPRAFVLGTHFDTRPWAEEDPDPARRSEPLPGANDGTSGLAILLELAPLLDDVLPRAIGFTVIAFDGEELGRPGAGGYCVGSQALSRAMQSGEFSDLTDAEFGIVLDMVGGSGQTLPMEPVSLMNNRGLVEELWQRAKSEGLSGFSMRIHHQGIYDDHVPLTQAGVPSVLLIDHEYRHWHTHADTIDKLSSESLESVGEALRVYLVGRYGS